MGQKVNPHGLRVGIIRNWDSRWFVRDDQFGDLVVEDDKIRKFVKKKIASAGVPKIEIRYSFTVQDPARLSARAAPRSKSSDRASKNSSKSPLL